MENLEPKFDFDDILIVPAVHTQITSRYRDIKLPDTLPLFTAPMDTVVDLTNVEIFEKAGINIALPRTIKYEDSFNFIEDRYRNKNRLTKIFISMGFDDIDRHLANNLKHIRHNGCILIDVANGHMEKIVDYAKKIKAIKPEIEIMVGNIANPETYCWYVENECVDYIRIGIGNGNGCLTTKQSGIGYPMASLIYETSKLKYEMLMFHDDKPIKLPYIVADGGMKDYSDIIKSLALGADYVMIGSIFNKALESSAKNYLYKIRINKKLAKFAFKRGFPVKKYFRGMSTKEAQKTMGKTSFRTSEGVVRIRRVEYNLDGWVENFKHYLRNAMSYANVKTLEDFIDNVEICQISKNAYERFNK